MHKTPGILLFALVGCATQPLGTESDELDGTSHACYATRMGSVVRLDLAKETITPIDGLPVVEGSDDISSLGLVADGLVECTGAGVVYLDLRTNTAELIPTSCVSVTADGERIWVQSLAAYTLSEYADLDALRGGHASKIFKAPFATRLGYGQGQLLASWHSAAEVLTVDQTTGETTPHPMPGYDGWIYGLAERDGLRFVAGGWVETGIYDYDATSGAFDHKLFDGEWLQGLACEPGRPGIELDRTPTGRTVSAY